MTQIITSGSVIINDQPDDSVIAVNGSGVPTGLITRADGSSFIIGDLHNYPSPAELHTGVSLPEGDRADLSWNGTAVVYAAPAPEPVPAVVTMAQARIALFRAGKLDAVQTAVNGAGGETEIWWDHATEVHRSNPLVTALGAAVGLDSDAIDTLFRVADTIS